MDWGSLGPKICTIRRRLRGVEWHIVCVSLGAGSSFRENGARGRAGVEDICQAKVIIQLFPRLVVESGVKRSNEEALIGKFLIAGWRCIERIVVTPQSVDFPDVGANPHLSHTRVIPCIGRAGRLHTEVLGRLELELADFALSYIGKSCHAPRRRLVTANHQANVPVLCLPTSDAVHKLVPFFHVRCNVITESRNILEVISNSSLWHGQDGPLRCRGFKDQSPVNIQVNLKLGHMRTTNRASDSLCDFSIEELAK